MKKLGFLVFFGLFFSTSVMAEQLVLNSPWFRGGTATVVNVNNTEACEKLAKEIVINLAFPSAANAGYSMSRPSRFLCVKSDGTITKSGKVYALATNPVNGIPCIHKGSMRSWYLDDDICPNKKFVYRAVILPIHSQPEDMVDYIEKRMSENLK